MERPETIKKSIEKNIFLRQEYDVNGRIRYAMSKRETKIEVPYIVCETLEKDLRKAGYRVRTENHFFWGKRTFIEW